MSDTDVKDEQDEEQFSSNDSDDESIRLEPKFQLCLGLREDCARLAALVRGQLTVQALFDGWKELRFHRIYMGRRFFTELLEFTEEALVIVRDLWLDVEKDLRDQASYFLVLAGLYLRQPFVQPSKPARIRLTSKHVDQVSAFIDNCDTNGFHDCVRLLDALFSEGALDLVAYPREFGLERNTLAYLRRDSLKRSVLPEKGPSVSELPELTDLRTALAEYCAVKRGLDNAPNFVTSKRLDDLVPRIEEIDDDDDDDDDDDNGDKEWKPDSEDRGKKSSIGTRRQRLRDQAFSAASSKQLSVVDMKLEKEVKSEEPATKRPKRAKITRRKLAKIKTFY